MSQSFDLRRFVLAQDSVFGQVVEELETGRKRSHWMWFVFPQIVGLGHSAMAARYAIGSLAEAQTYLRHELLGPRLCRCTELVNRIEGRSAVEIFGRPDDLKFLSSMTIFAQADTEPSAFTTAIERLYGGQPDRATLDILRAG